MTKAVFRRVVLVFSLFMGVQSLRFNIKEVGRASSTHGRENCKVPPNLKLEQLHEDHFADLECETGQKDYDRPRCHLWRAEVLATQGAAPAKVAEELKVFDDFLDSKNKKRPPRWARWVYDCSDIEHLGAWGDPHAANLRGEEFDILSLGQVDLIVYPQGSPESESKLVIRALIQQGGVHCHDTFMKDISLSGSWLNDTFSFKENEDTGELLIFKNNILHSLNSNESSKPEDPQIDFINKRTISFKPSQSKTEVVIFSEGRVHQGQGIYLNLKLTGFTALEGAVGGLLGLDDHDSEMKLDKELCQQGRGENDTKEAVRMEKRLSAIKGMSTSIHDKKAPSLHAEVKEASLEDDDTKLFHISIS